MNYFSLLRSGQFSTTDFSTREELFDFLNVVADNSFCFSEEVQKWVTSTLTTIDPQSLSLSEWNVVAGLALINAKMIPSSFLDQFQYLEACIRNDYIPPLMHLRSVNPVSLSDNRDRFITQRKFISLDAWAAIKI